MGIPEMLASSQDSGGMEGFFNSPIAMILMPRTAARFQAAKKDQMLLEQYNRKVQLAGQFADQIESKDPMAAAMIRADPSTMDNVFSAYYSAQKAQDLAKTNFGYDMQKEAEKARLARETEIAKNNLPGGVGAYQEGMKAKLLNTVQRDGMLGPAYPNAQGPAPRGQLQQGQDASAINPDMAAAAFAEDYNLPGLTQGNAMRIMEDPKAVEDLQDNRRADIEQGAKTVDIVVDGVTKKFALNSKTGKYDTEVGDVPKSAEELKLGSQTINRLDSDGVVRTYAFVPGSGYTKSEGLTPPPADGNLGKHVEVYDPKDNKTYIMGWDPKTKGYTQKIGLAEPKTGTPMYAADGVTITGYVGGPGKKNDRTEAGAKGDSLFEGIRGLKTDTLDNFDELGKPQNTAGAANYDRGGGFVMSGPAQVGMGSLKQVAQTYIYAQSGQQAPDSEVNRIMSMVMPALSDKPEMRAFKKKLLANMFVSINAKTSTWDQGKWEAEMQAAPVNKDLKVADPSGSAPPLPESLKKGGITKEFWEANPQYWPEAN